MKNSTEKLGERIRTQRLRSNMTQTQLSDGIVSRNMLCMIEGGKTLPSAETVSALANRLEVPVGMLFAADEAGEAMYTKIENATKAKKLFSMGKYSECAEICKTVPFDDEMTALLAECFLKEAEEDMKKYMLSSAVSHLESAREISKNTIYLDDSFRGTVDAYLYFISCAGGNIDSDKLTKICRTKCRIEPSYPAYLTILSKLDKNDFEDVDKMAFITSLLSREHLSYLKANKLIREFSYTKALTVLLQLENNKKLDFITKYRVLADIEKCYENKRDFENAYKYSTVKYRMLENFRN